MSMSRTRYSLALASAATLAGLSCGPLVGAASANPGGVPHHGGDKGKHLGQVKHGQDKHGDRHGDKHGDKTGKPDKDKGGHGGHGSSHGQSHGSAHWPSHGQAHAPGQVKDKDKDKGPKGSKGSKGSKGPKGPKGHPGNHGNGHHGNGASAHAGQHADPPGNNGTVKIAGPGDAVGHPSNNPHPGCTVIVEWFGFDAGDDVVSTVTFSPQAPTKDISIGGTSPSSVFVGGDAASGGTDLDGRQAYTLTFEGEPHPQQGYHVKVVVATPRSLGNDTKSKVFWVEPCDAPAPSTTEEEAATTTDATDATDAADAADATDAVEQGVLGTSAEVESEAAVAAEAEDADAAVPTSVDAGEDGTMLGDWARSPWPLVAIAGGLTVAGVALARRSSRNGA